MGLRILTKPHLWLMDPKRIRILLYMVLVMTLYFCFLHDWQNSRLHRSINLKLTSIIEKETAVSMVKTVYLDKTMRLHSNATKNEAVVLTRKEIVQQGRAENRSHDYRQQERAGNRSHENRGEFQDLLRQTLADHSGNGSSQDYNHEVERLAQQILAYYSGKAMEKDDRNSKSASAGQNKNGKKSVLLTILNNRTNYDEYIQIVMNTKDKCSNASSYDAIMVVHTAPTNFYKREVFRWLYSDQQKIVPFRLKVVFLLGLVTNSTLQDLLIEENQEYGDTVQGNFIDSYRNLTYKAVMGFNWVDLHCRGLKALFRVDDDVFLNTPKVIYKWKDLMKLHNSEKLIWCDTINKDLVMRKGKWAVPKSLVPEDRYEFVRCLGYFAGISPDLIRPMTEEAKKLQFFWIDDVVMYGLVPHAIGGIRIMPTSSSTSKPNHIRAFRECYRTRGDNCQLMIGIGNVAEFKSMYSDIHTKRT